jgi:hypothetical protein
MKYRLVFFISLIISSINAASQDYPKDYFRSPVDIPIFLAGNFGEIRSGHFHAGLDVKTEGVEGKKIYAVAEGYVSRIKISKGGYGKALYITHPNGYTTTYAHLKNYSPKIEAIVNNAQYEKESYEIEIFPSKEELIVTKGEIVAVSGNSGGSGGPHLHFEIRESASEIPVNPLLFGFEIKDDIKPIIKSLGIYPTEGGVIGNSIEKKLIKVTSENGIYSINNQKLIASGKIGLGIEVIDKLNGSNNRCGAYSIELLVDSMPVYCHEMEKIGFHETRYINSHVNYEHWKKDKARVQRSYVQPNNKLDVYACDKKGYVFDFNDSLTHHFTYIIRDAFMNTSFLDFDIQSTLNNDLAIVEIDSSLTSRLFKHEETNSFETESLKLNLPANILYDDIDFTYSISEPKGRAITPIHHIHDMYTPLHSYMSLSIKVDSINEEHIDKALIVALDKNLAMLAPEGGNYDKGWISIRTRSMGPYTVMIDSIAPIIKPHNIVNGRDMSKKWSIMMTISDELSGIKTYRGTIDGKWVLFEYNYKKNRLTYFFDEKRLEKGVKHQLYLEVSDKRNNISKYDLEFYW